MVAIQIVNGVVAGSEFGKMRILILHITEPYSEYENPPRCLTKYQ